MDYCRKINNLAYYSKDIVTILQSSIQMRRLIILSIILIVSTFAYASNQYLSFSDGYVDSTKFKVARTITRFNSYIEVHYEIEGVYVSENIYDNQTYGLITLENAGHSNTKGEPELPIYSDMFIVDSKDVTVEVVHAEYEEFKDFTISPATGYSQLGEENKISSRQCSDVYKQNRFFPANNITINGRYQYRGIPYVNVQFHPVQYNPVTRTIRCYKSITYKIPGNHVKRNNHFNGKDLKRLEELVENYDVIDKTDVERTTIKAAPASSQEIMMKEHADYLIVTVDSFMPAVEHFVQWKAQLGFKCKVLSEKNWSDAAALISAISHVYESDKPHYLLIVGGYKHVTSNAMVTWDKHYVSDLPYATVGSDNYLIPDLTPGRLTVSTLEEANLVVDKIIRYEKNPVEDSLFYQTATHITNVEDVDKDESGVPQSNGYEDGRFLCTSEEIRDYMQGWGKNVRRMYNYSVNKPTHYNKNIYCDGSEIPQELLDADVWGVSSQDIADELSKGSFYVLYNSHGNVQLWGSKDGDYFTNDKASNLTNQERLPVIFSITCLSGRFNESSCIAESFLTAKNGGAVGVIAASETSTFLWSDLLAEGIFNTMFPNPGIDGKWGNYNHPGWYVVEYEKESTAEYRMGKVMRNGLFRMYKMLPSNDDICAKFTCEEYHYFGDPTMEIYTDVPQCIHPTITQEGSSVTVSTEVESDCRIVLTSSLDYGQSYMAVAEGVSSAIFDNVDFPYTVTITKHNYKPYVSGPDTTYLQNLSITTDGEIKSSVIYLGGKVTNTLQDGDVIVSSGTLKLVAQNNIRLQSGFSTNGGKVFAQIEKYNQCNFPNREPATYHPNLPNESQSTDIKEVQSFSDNSIFVDNGEVTIKFDTPQNIIITDVLGRIVYEKNHLVEGSLHLANGLYIVHYGDKSVKIIVK